MESSPVNWKVYTAKYKGKAWMYFGAVRDAIRRATKCSREQMLAWGCVETDRWIEAGCPAYTRLELAAADWKGKYGDQVVKPVRGGRGKRADAAGSGEVASDKVAVSAGAVADSQGDVASRGGPAVAAPRVTDMLPSSVMPAEERAQWDRLKAAGKGRKCSKQTSQEWVAAHLSADPSSIQDADVPDPGTIELLMWARRNRDEFMRQMYGKVGAAKQAQVNDGRLTDTGESITELLTQWERAMSDEPVPTERDLAMAAG